MQTELLDLSLQGTFKALYLKDRKRRRATRLSVL